MLVEFSGKKTFPLEFNVNDKDVSVLFDSYAVNEAFDVLAGDPQKWMSGDQWETLTSSCAQFLENNSADSELPQRVRLSSDTVKSIIQDGS